jgi:hypothetical protein
MDGRFCAGRRMARPGGPDQSEFRTRDGNGRLPGKHDVFRHQDAPGSRASRNSKSPSALGEREVSGSGVFQSSDPANLSITISLDFPSH